MGNNLKIYIQELWFLCIRRRLTVPNKCMKFRWNNSNGYQVIERTQNSIAKRSKGNHSKNIQSRVTALLYVTLSFCALSVSSFNQIAWIVFNLQSGQKLHLVMLQGEYFEKNKHAKIIVLVYDTSSECTVHTYKVSLKLSKGNNSKNIQSRVMVLLHDAVSFCSRRVWSFNQNTLNSVQFTELAKLHLFMLQGE